MQQNEKNKAERLSHRVVKSGFWVFALRISHRLFGLARLIVLARILAPNDFGLMGIALLMMSTVETFSQTGFQQALIQKQANVEEFLNSAWTVLIVRGIILFSILYFIAPFASIFFNSPKAQPIIQAISLSILFQAFTNIGVIYFQKELEFNKQFIFQLSGTLVDFIVAVSAALLLKSVWALVLGLLAGNFTRCIVSYYIHPYRPHLSSDLSKASELFDFGKWILASSIITYIGMNLDTICVGRLLGATALGFYQMAFNIANIPANEITYVIGNVALPAYSKIQDNQEKLHNAYFRMMGLTLAISIPLAVGIFFLAPEFTMIFFGEKWMPMVVAMRLIAVAGLFKSIVSTGSPLFAGSGNPRYEFYMQLIRSIIIMLMIYPLTSYLGIQGAAFSVILSAAGMFAVWYPYSQKITAGSLEKYLEILGPLLLSALCMAGTITACKAFWNPAQQPFILAIATFFLIVIASIAVYIAVCYIFKLYRSTFTTFDDVKLIRTSILGK